MPNRRSDTVPNVIFSFMEKAARHERLKSSENLSIPAEFHYSVDTEISRVRNTVRKYRWFQENGYQPRLPQDIKVHLDNGADISDEEIRSAVEAEYKDQAYSEKAQELTEAWETESDDFLEKLKTLGRPLPKAYNIFLSTYGTGGSYGYPDTIQLNLNNASSRGVLYVTFHEIVHLAIQDLIEKYNIPHWTKERLVDLTMNAFFPDKKQLQRDPEHAELVATIFERGFPNIEKVIAEIAEV